MTVEPMPGAGAGAGRGREGVRGQGLTRPRRVVAIDQMRMIDRNCEIPHEGPFCDLMWSDPEDIETWAISPRGAGWLFGSRVTAEFNEVRPRNPQRKKKG